MMQKHSNISNNISTTGKLVALALILSVISSCTITKNVVYFENGQKDTLLKTFVNRDLEAKIRKNDAISISVSSISLETPA